MRFQFDIELHKIELQVPYQVQVQIVWKKGKSIIKFTFYFTFRLKKVGI